MKRKENFLNLKKLIYKKKKPLKLRNEFNKFTDT